MLQIDDELREKTVWPTLTVKVPGTYSFRDILRAWFGATLQERVTANEYKALMSDEWKNLYAHGNVFSGKKDAPLVRHEGLLMRKKNYVKDILCHL